MSESPKATTANCRVFLTADQKKAVPEGDEEAAFLFCTPGMEIADSDVERYGLRKIFSKAEKEREKSANKERDPAEDKTLAPGLHVKKLKKA